MSEFVSQNMLPDLWKNILDRHWRYLETEENMSKIDERKKLESCLKNFLCIVPHDRKFFLPETAYVLQKSVEEMADFSAYNAMIGFESISQYANNLFTKPWRKEFKVIKMYSGFYQHEIKSKLLYAEKLFEAMGYRQFNQLLILDGPICPDQVTNVSRDAMAAYVECQIMKQILSGLTSMKLSCSWLEIFKFRETHISGQSQAIKMMAIVLEEKRIRKEKYNQENCYGTKHQHPVQNYYANCSCSICHLQNSTTNHHAPVQPLQPCQIHNTTASTTPTVIQKYPQHSCGIHGKQIQQSNNHNGIYNNSQLNFPNYPHMSHSKSLEHYNDSIASNILPQRHSFDHYEPSFDCVDTGCSTYNAYNHHPYNAPGNRYPLPYNISNHLMYGQNGSYHQQQQQQQPNIAPPIPPPPSTVHSNINGAGAIGGNFNQVGHLTNIENNTNYGGFQKQQLSHHYPIKSFSHDSASCNLHARDEYLVSQNHRRSIPGAVSISAMQNEQLVNLSNQLKDNIYIDTDDTDGNYIYSKPRHTQSNLAKKITPGDLQKLHSDNSDSCKLSKQTTSSSAAGSLSSKSSKSICNKNQDGVGSFESWNFVFQNLEKHGYSKDLGERGDLLMQGLEIKTNDMNGIRPHSPYVEDENQIQSGLQQQHLSRKNRESSTSYGTAMTLTQQSSSSKSKERLEHKNNQNHGDVKIPNASSSTTATLTTNNRDSSVSRSTAKSHKTKNVKNSVNNNVENYLENLSTVSSPGNCKTTVGEWGCRFCTFLNPDSKRICEMCARSKDFVLDTTKPSAATCV